MNVRWVAQRSVLAKSLLAALVLHAMLLGGFATQWRHAVPQAPIPAAMWVRTIETVHGPAAVRAAREESASMPGRPSVPKPEEEAKPRRGAVEAARGMPPARVAKPPVLVKKPDSNDAAQPHVPPQLVRSPKVEAPSGDPAPASTRDVPLYATMIPPAASLQFRMRRGAVQGNAALSWRTSGEQYEARLESRVAGALLLAQSSQGAFDAAGLAPQRFVDQRARRGALAISFQREAGKISFSSVSAEIELGAGVQDRLSWLVQLVAIAGAEPQRLAPEGKITLAVVGVRGDAALWHFVSLGEGRLDADLGASPAFHLQRLPSSIYDTHVDVWLDTKPPHWPLRAHLRNGPSDPGLELWQTGFAEIK